MKNKLLLLLLSLTTLCGCSKEPTPNKSITANISGLIEKGPFVQGSTVTLSELNDRLEATGRSFTTTTINDQGAFNFPELELLSKYVQISIDGYYFDEVSGKLSGSRIVLSAYSDITSSSININTLTHLEMERVKFLIINSNMSFDDAKNQAQTEVLKAFSITKTTNRPENISITSNNSDAGVLLAVSAILLKNNTDASLTEMLAKFGQDIADNGMLDNTSLITHISEASKYLSVKTIRNNIVERYRSLGKEVTVPDFSEFVTGLWKPDLNQPITATLELSINRGSRRALVYTDLLELKQLQVLVFSSDSTRCLFKTKTNAVSNNRVQIELPAKIMEPYDADSLHSRFIFAVVANSSTDFSSFDGSVNNLKILMENTVLADMNLPSMVGYDFSVRYTPDNGFPATGISTVDLTYSSNNNCYIALNTYVSKVRVIFDSNIPDIQSLSKVTIKNVNLEGYLFRNEYNSTQSRGGGKTDLSQLCNSESGACFYLYPSSDVTICYELGDEQVNLLHSLFIVAGVEYVITISDGAVRYDRKNWSNNDGVIDIE